MKKRSFIFNTIVSSLSLALILSMASPFVSINLSAIPSYLGLFFPFICISSIILSLICMIRANSRWWFLALTLISLFFLPRFVAFHSNAKSETGIDILSLNVRGGYSIINKNKGIETEKTKALIELFNNDIEILAVQEMNQRVLDWVNEELVLRNKITSKRKGTFIATNFEIVDHGEVDFGTKVNSCIWADIMTPEGRIRVYNVHFQSNKIYEETEKVINEGREYDPHVFSSMEVLFGKYKRQAQKRLRQAHKVKAHMTRCNSPILLTGDFNETPMSNLYQTFLPKMTDLFKSGKGLGLTYPESSPILRIDYILGSENIVGEEFEVFNDISLSDHLPIKASITISK